MDHPDESAAYVRAHAQEMDPDGDAQRTSSCT